MELQLGNDISSILKRDGVVVGSAALVKNWLAQHAKTSFGKKIGGISVKKFAKGLGYVELANAASTTVQDLLPHVSEALDWSMALPFNILNQTLGRIPGVGAVFRWLHNLVTNTVTKLADLVGLDGLAVTGSKLVLKDPNEGFETETNFKDPGKKYSPKEDEEVKNDPKFYENLDLHKSFSIPGSYTKTTLLNGTLSMPTIVVHRLSENANADNNATLDRLNQKFALIKAVRGLSATQYAVIDLFNYERMSKFTLHLYYSVKFVVQAAKTYSVVQTEIGNNMIRAKGFDPSEVRHNLALYESWLCQCHRFMTNNLPMTGTWIKRLTYLKTALIPDYSDDKIATIHMFDVNMTDVFKSASDATGLTFDEIPEAGNNSYTVVLQHLTDIENAVVGNSLWQQLIADYFGAFGAQAMWEDRDYPAYSKPLNLRNADNDLSREQIKNAMYANAKITVVSITNGIPNAKITADVDDLKQFQYPNLVPNYNQDFTGEVRPTYSTYLDSSCYKKAESGYKLLSGMQLGKYLIPDYNGVAAQVIDVDSSGGNADETVYMVNSDVMFTLHKDNYSEGEALEISQFKIRNLKTHVFQGNNGTFAIDSVFVTNEFAVIDSIVYTYASAGGSYGITQYRVCNESVADDDLQSVESSIDFPDEMSCWSLIDWMPGVHATFFGYDANAQDYSPRDVYLLDIDGYGSLSFDAFKTSINYTIYSLLGAGLKVDKNSKRVSNLGDVYKDKKSRQG